MGNRTFSLFRMFFSRMPTYMIFFVTSRCNSRCKMCFYWKNIEGREKKELDLQEIEKISRSMGFLQYLTISGGEPTLRDDLPDIISTFYRNNHVQFFSIPTNGLQPERIAGLSERIFRECPEASFRIALSLDGIGKDHDEIRGVKGNFEKVLETYNLLDKLRSKYNNFNIDMTTVFSSYNQDKVISIFKWVKNNLKVDNHVLLLTRGNAREASSKDISPEKYKEAVKFVEKLALSSAPRRRDFRLRLLRAIKLVMRDIILKTLKYDRMIIPCVAGKKMIVLSEQGDVYPCELLNRRMGNVRESEYDMRKIYFSKAAKDVRKFIRKSNCYCTFECAIQNSIVYHPASYFNVICKMLS